MNYISVINVNAISLISCSFKSPKSFISTFRLALRALARSSCFWLAWANLASNFKTTSIVHRVAGFEILLSQLLLHERFVWLGAQVKHNRGTWWAVRLPQGGGNEVDLLAPWQSVPAVWLLCKGVSPPSVHLSIALLLYFVNSPVLKTPIRRVLGHPLEWPSKWVMSVGLDLA